MSVLPSKDMSVSPRTRAHITIQRVLLLLLELKSLISYV